jgi:hypothetical protein
MNELLLVEMKRAVQLLERGEITPELKSLLATIRKHSIILVKEESAAKTEQA